MRVIVRTFSELCITFGALIVLFVTYVLYWTGVKADAAMDGQLDQLEDRWANGAMTSAELEAAGGSSDVTEDGNPPPPEPYEDGKPFAVMYIPRLGDNWTKPVLENTKTGTLKKGLGHYASTAQLGQKGNFAVAGHRRTYGDPFKDFPKLRKGDAVVLNDGRTWFTYRIENKKPYKTLPSDIAVIDPVPRKSGFTDSGRYLTLTTCEPEWGHSHRLIVWAYLDSTQPVDDGKPEALRR
ncbi:class E sortase [Streptomyces sp. TRM66268-LWL]|uniref:Class E sortase n=1 Tax=Streptomyces polyasparticus TaxID=2767826 RepID=A0ABR7SFH6_9ACTN|nr:class E sortase [Streptomyces polyasparticus]MBC9714246.1 class E sortase [Streptomyces polyasparticus]